MFSVISPSLCTSQAGCQSAAGADSTCQQSVESQDPGSPRNRCGEQIKHEHPLVQTRWPLGFFLPASQFINGKQNQAYGSVFRFVQVPGFTSLVPVGFHSKYYGLFEQGKFYTTRHRVINEFPRVWILRGKWNLLKTLVAQN